MKRNAAIDHIRIMLTALVIFHHTAIVYGGAGSWYWSEIPERSSLPLVGFNAVNQSFFMGFFFLISGYFTRASLEKRDGKAFLKERLVRLGIPLAVYFLFISPLTITMATQPSVAGFLPELGNSIKTMQFEPGPLWFTQALLIFSVIYLGWRLVSKKIHTQHYALPGFLWLLLSAILISLAAFSIRLFVPVGETILWLQPGYFPCYAFLFFAGCLARPARTLENIDLKSALPWIGITLIALASLPYVMVNGIDAGAFEGGPSFNAMYYALWDPLMAWGIILGMLWVAGSCWNHSSTVTGFFTRRAYGIFIIHPPVLVALSLLMSGVDASPFIKFLAVGSLCFLLCAFLVSLLLTIPLVRRII